MQAWSESIQRSHPYPCLQGGAFLATFQRTHLMTSLSPSERRFTSKETISKLGKPWKETWGWITNWPWVTPGEGSKAGKTLSPKALQLKTEQHQSPGSLYKYLSLPCPALPSSTHTCWLPICTETHSLMKGQLVRRRTMGPQQSREPRARGSFDSTSGGAGLCATMLTLPSLHGKWGRPRVPSTMPTKNLARDEAWME